MTSSPTLPRPALSAFLGIVLLLALSACDLLGPSGPEGPGFLDLELHSPHGQEGAALLELVGGAGRTGMTCQGGSVFYQHHGDRSRVVVVLDEPGTIRFRVETENVGKTPEVTVLQVSGGDDALRGALSGYRVGVEVVKASKGGAW